MLRYCFCQKINYLQRLTPPPLLVDFVAKFDDLKRDIFRQILRKPDISDSLWTQCCLDIQDGGLGYQLTSHVTTVAYIASVFDAKADLDALFPGFINRRTSKMVNAFHDSLSEYGHLISDDQR